MSRLDQDIKSNRHRLREYAYQIAGPDKKARLDNNLLKIPSESVFSLNQETVKLGIMIPQYYIVDNRIHFWREDD